MGGEEEVKEKEKEKDKPPIPDFPKPNEHEYVKKGGDCPGHVLREKVRTTLAVCEGICDRDSFCEGISWHPQTRNCLTQGKTCTKLVHNGWFFHERSKPLEASKPNDHGEDGKDGQEKEKEEEE